MMILQIALSILPCIAIVILIYRADLYEKEDVFNLFAYFVLGIGIAIPLYFLQGFFYQINIAGTRTVLGALFVSFILVSLTEESFKFLALQGAYRSKFFDEPIDGIVYATMIGMGFATMENFFYITGGIELSGMIIRAFTAVPAHASFAAIMGFFVGKAKFSAGNKRRLLLLGCLLPIGVHGLYDFFIIQEVYDVLIILAIVVLSTAIFFSIRLIKEQQRNSPYKKEEEQEEIEEDNPFQEDESAV